MKTILKATYATVKKMRFSAIKMKLIIIKQLISYKDLVICILFSEYAIALQDTGLLVFLTDLF